MANDCLVKKYKATVDNNNLPKFGAISVGITGVNAVTTTINSSQYSLFRLNNPTGYAEIVGAQSSTLGGGTKALLSEAPSLNIAQGDSFQLYVDDKYKIISINKTNTNFLLEGTLDLKYLLECSSVKLYDCDNDDIYIKNPPASLTKLLLRGTGINADIAGIDLHLLSELELNIPIDITVKEIVDALTYNNNPCLISNFASVFGNNLKLTGDIMDLPSNASYINLPANDKNVICTLGKRNTSDCKIICIGLAGTSYLKTTDDVDNFFINNAACTMDSSVTNKIMHLNVNGTYSPSAEAQTAITTLKSKGVTSIKVNGTSL